MIETGVALYKSRVINWQSSKRLIFYSYCDTHVPTRQFRHHDIPPVVRQHIANTLHHTDDSSRRKNYNVKEILIESYAHRRAPSSIVRLVVVLDDDVKHRVDRGVASTTYEMRGDEWCDTYSHARPV